MSIMEKLDSPFKKNVSAEVKTAAAIDKWTEVMEKEHMEVVAKASKHMENANGYILFYTKTSDDFRKEEDTMRAFLVDELLEMLSFITRLSIAMLDMEIVRKGFLRSSSDWEERYFKKNFYLIIVETINKFKTEADFKGYIEKSNYDLRAESKYCFAQLEAYKLLHDFNKGMKGNIRNKTAGHIHKDLTEYYDILYSLDTEKAINAFADFSKLLDKFIKLTFKVFKLRSESFSESIRADTGKLRLLNEGINTTE